MPAELKECMHMLMIIMWATEVTPTTWKESYTCLLEKDKGNQAEVKNRRPVGMLNTINKLWTKLTTRATTDYAERFTQTRPQKSGYYLESFELL